MKIGRLIRALLAFSLVASNIFGIPIAYAETDVKWILDPTSEYDNIRSVIGNSEGGSGVPFSSVLKKYAIVNKESKSGIIDLDNGKLLFDMRSGIIEPFNPAENNDIILYYDDKSEKYRFLNLKGETMLGAYDHVYRQLGGYLLINNEICSYVDKNLSVLVQPNPAFKYITHMAKDICVVKKSNDKYQMYKAGSGLIGREYDSTASQMGCDNYSMLRIGTAGYIFDPDGNEIGRMSNAPDNVFFFQCYGKVYVGSAATISSAASQVRPLSNLDDVFPGELFLGGTGTDLATTPFTTGDIVPYAISRSGGWTTHRYGFVSFTASGISIIVPPTYTLAGSFIEGLAMVNLNGKCGYINRSGETIIEPQYEEASRFMGGFALVKSGENKYHVIDRNNTRVFTSNTPIYGSAYPFFYTNNKLINPNNNFETVHEVNMDRAVVLGASCVRFAAPTSPHCEGLLDAGFNVILKPVYTEIVPLDNEYTIFAVCTQDNKWGIVRLSAGASTKPPGGGGSGSGITACTVTFCTNNGSVVSSQNVARNGKAARPADPTKEGFVFAGWCSDKELTKEFDFGMALISSVTIYAKWTAVSELQKPSQPAMAANPFADVKGDDWFIYDVIYSYANGLMVGTSTAPMLFSPNVKLTRGMVLQILYNIAGNPDTSGLCNPFDDVAERKWYSAAVNWAAASGIVSGHGNGKFGPDDNVTREQIAVMLHNYVKWKGVSLSTDSIAVSFVDESQVSSWALEAVRAAQLAGIFGGKPGNLFDPNALATRAEAAAVFARFSIVMSEARR